MEEGRSVGDPFVEAKESAISVDADTQGSKGTIG